MNWPTATTLIALGYFAVVAFGLWLLSRIR